MKYDNDDKRGIKAPSRKRGFGGFFFGFEGVCSTVDRPSLRKARSETALWTGMAKNNGWRSIIHRLPSGWEEEESGMETND